MKLLAPNGKPSNLNPEQYRLVRTPAFKKWFGDWESDAENSSKVVDENGEPLVVWHGSKSLFNEFTLLPETSEAGFHFGTLSQAQFRIKSSKEKYFYQCFLNIRNIVETTDMVFFSKHKISLKLQEQGIFTHEEYQNWHKFYDIIKEKKIDGLKYLNKWEGYGNEFSYNVFYPEQIKLADGTNTTFDANNPDIRFGNGGGIEKLAFIQKNENGFYWLYAINDKGDNYKDIDGDKRLYVVKDMAERFGYKLVSAKQFNDFYKIDDRFKMYENRRKFKLGGTTMRKPKNMLLAPNGKPSNLTPEQYRIVRTSAFKNWFGDWENDAENSSKVVDYNGEPLPVYHGTNSEPFVVFYDGSFFTDDYMNADGYASGEMIYEVFLNIKKPLIINARGRKWDNLKNKYGNSTRDIASELDMDKYDGVIFNNINDNWFDDEMGDTQNVYFSTNANQIKLADGTNTTFDGNNSDIRYSGGGSVNAEIIGLSKISKKLSYNDFLSKTDSTNYNILYRGGYLDNQVFMTDYIGHARQYSDEVNGIVFNYDDLLIFNDSVFNNLRKQLKNITKDELKKIYKSFFENGKLFDAMVGKYSKNSSVINFVYGFLKSDVLYSKVSQIKVENDLLVPIMLYYAKKKNKNIISFLGGDYSDYGGAYEYVVNDIYKYTTLKDIWEKSNKIKYELGGEITLTTEQVEKKLGRKLHWWNDDVVSINGIDYKKVFLKPEYKRL